MAINVLATIKEQNKKIGKNQITPTPEKNTTPKKEIAPVQTLAPLSPRGITSVVLGGTDNKVTDAFGNVYYDDPKIPNKMQEFKNPENLKMPDNKDTVLEAYQKNAENIPLLNYNQNNSNKLVSKVIPNNTLTVPKISEENKKKIEPFSSDSVLKPLDYTRKQIKEEQSKLVNSYESDIYKKTYSVAEKYGFNPDTFGSKDYLKFAYTHKFETKEDREDLKMLETLAARNERYKIGKEHPYLSSAATIATAVPRGVAGIVATVEDGINVARGKEIDPLSNAHTAGNASREIRQSVDENHASKAFGGKELPVIGNVGSFLYNAGMSMGDSAITLATGQALFGGISNVTTARNAISAFVSGTMASSAAADAVVENKKRGFSDKRALALGIATGLVEAATEKFSIDNILKQPKTAIKALGRGFVAEGSEEAVSEVANGFIDLVVNGSDSELVSRYNEYKKMGYNDKTALIYTFADSASQVASSFLAGGLSGMAMSGTAYSRTALQNRSNAKSLGITTKQYNALNSTDNKKITKVFSNKGFSEIVKPLSEINTEITKLQKEGKENTTEYLELISKKADITQNVVRELQKNAIERNKYSKLTSDVNILRQQYPHATDEQIEKLSKLVGANEKIWHNKKYANDFLKHEVFTTYLQQNEEIHRLVDEITLEERKHKYKNMSFKSVEDSAMVSDMDIDLFNKLSEMFGTKYVIDSSLQYDGEYKDGTIFINPASKSIHQNVYAHELVHHGENSPQYQAFKEEVLKGGYVSSWAKNKGYEFDNFKNMYKDAYKHAYGASSENLDTLVENEIVADYVADILTQDVSYLNKMAQQDTGFRKILSYIRDFFAKIADKLHLSNSDARYAKQLVNKFTEVLNTVDNSKSVENADSFVKDKINIINNAENIIENYKKDIKNFFNNGTVPQKGYFDLGFPTNILADKIKNQNNIIMREDVLIKATGGKHSISINEMSKLAEKLQEPLMIFKSDTVKDAYVLFVEMVNKQNIPVVVAIHLNKYNGRNRVTNIASVYSKIDVDTYKDNTQRFIDKQVEKGNFVYANKKSQSWFTTFGLRLPSVVQTYIDSTNNIPQQSENVNKNSSKKKIAIFDDTDAIDIDARANRLARGLKSGGKTLDEDVEKIVKTVYHTPTEQDLHTWRIAKLFKSGGRIFANYDISRNLDYLSNGDRKLREVLRNEIEKPFFKAKANFAVRYPDKLNNFHKIIVQQYGIKQGSKESAALQWYGEGFVPNQINMLLEVIADEFYLEKGKQRKNMLLRSVSELEILLEESKNRAKRTKYTDERNGRLEIALKKFNKEFNLTDDVDSVMDDFLKDIRKILHVYENKESNHQPTPEDKQYELYTLEDLKKDFPDSWFKIAIADKYCRKIYNEYREEINEMLKKIYPYVEQLIKKYELKIAALNEQIESDPATIFVNQALIEDYRAGIDEAKLGKRLSERKDYYHHFREISSGLRGFAHLLKEDFEIPSKLAAVSANTQPKTKWAAFMQHRGFGEYTADAVGGMVNYMYAAEYKLHFDPFISKMRTIIKAIVKTTEETKNANSAINYLTKWTNDICGKSDGASRAIANFLGDNGRATVQAFKKLDGHLKASQILGNVRSAFVQFSNLPNMAAYVKNPKHAAVGAKMAFSFLAGNDDKLFQSAFLNERYMDDKTDIFDESLLHKPEKFALAMMSAGDKIASYIIWYSAYEQGKAQGLSDPVYYADDITRRCVAGRGIGEIPLAQKNLIVKTLMPFQIETNNFFNLVFEQLKKKNFIGLLLVFAWCYIFNLFFEKIFGSKVLPDLVDFGKEVYERHTDNEGTVALDTALTIASIGGRIASNSAYGNAVTSLLTNHLSNKELVAVLGDSSRYGLSNKLVDTIISLIADGATGKDFEVISYVASFNRIGGGQLKKMINAAQDYNYLPVVKVGLKNGIRIDNDKTINAHYKADGTVAYVLDDNPIEKIRAFAFGPSSTNAAQKYYDGESASYNEFSTEKMRELKKKGISEYVFDSYKKELKQFGNKLNAGNAITAIDKIPNLTNEQKNALFSATNKNWKASYFEAKANLPLDKLNDIAEKINENGSDLHKNALKRLKKIQNSSSLKKRFNNLEDYIEKQKARGLDENDKNVIIARQAQYDLATQLYNYYVKSYNALLK